jgi:hypothetical protein
LPVTSRITPGASATVKGPCHDPRQSLTLDVPAISLSSSAPCREHQEIGHPLASRPPAMKIALERVSRPLATRLTV